MISFYYYTSCAAIVVLLASGSLPFSGAQTTTTRRDLEEEEAAPDAAVSPPSSGTTTTIMDTPLPFYVYEGNDCSGDPQGSGTLTSLKALGEGRFCETALENNSDGTPIVTSFGFVSCTEEGAVAMDLRSCSDTACADCSQVAIGATFVLPPDFGSGSLPAADSCYGIIQNTADDFTVLNKFASANSPSDIDTYWKVLLENSCLGDLAAAATTAGSSEEETTTTTTVETTADAAATPEAVAPPSSSGTTTTTTTTAMDTPLPFYAYNGNDCTGDPLGSFTLTSFRALGNARFCQTELENFADGTLSTPIFTSWAFVSCSASEGAVAVEVQSCTDADCAECSSVAVDADFVIPDDWPAADSCYGIRNTYNVTILKMFDFELTSADNNNSLESIDTYWKVLLENSCLGDLAAAGTAAGGSVETTTTTAATTEDDLPSSSTAFPEDAVSDSVSTTDPPATATGEETVTAEDDSTSTVGPSVLVSTAVPEEEAGSTDPPLGEAPEDDNEEEGSEALMVDIPGWADSGGDDCSWWEAHRDSNCNDANTYTNANGVSAKDACVFCGGGQVVGTGEETTTHDETAPTQEEGAGSLIMTAGANDPDLSVFVELLSIYGLMENNLNLNESPTLTGPYTVFAPTDDAFASIDATLDGANDLIPWEIQQVLSYHVVPGAYYTPSNITDGLELETDQGTTIAFKVNDTGAFVTDSENEVSIDGNNRTITMDADSNGEIIIVLHKIDQVLFPAVFTAPPSNAPSQAPTRIATPTAVPTDAPTEAPTRSATPTAVPSSFPSGAPSQAPVCPIRYGPKTLVYLESGMEAQTGFIEKIEFSEYVIQWANNSKGRIDPCEEMDEMVHNADNILFDYRTYPVHTRLIKKVNETTWVNGTVESSDDGFFVVFWKDLDEKTWQVAGSYMDTMVEDYNQKYADASEDAATTESTGDGNSGGAATKPCVALVGVVATALAFIVVWMV